MGTKIEEINPYLLPVGWIKISWDGRKNHGSCLSFSFVKVDGFLEIIVENHIDKLREREKASFRERERERRKKEKGRGGVE
jgi:hypothetical protein